MSEDFKSGPAECQEFHGYSCDRLIEHCEAAKRLDAKLTRMAALLSEAKAAMLPHYANDDLAARITAELETK